MTSSLSAFFTSLILGGLVVVLPISAALVWVSNQDKTRRA